MTNRLIWTDDEGTVWGEPATNDGTGTDVLDLDYALRVADARVAAVRALVGNPRVKFVYAAAIRRALDVEPTAFAVPGAVGGQTGSAPAPATKAGATDV